MIRSALLLFLVFSSLFAGSGAAQTQSSKQKPEEPIRFASLRADEVNVRAGPGVRYPVKWVFVRKTLPVAITAEFESWRKIRDSEDAEGWVHRAMLSAKRSVLIMDQTRTMRRSASEKSPAVAQLTPGIVAQIESCDGRWCELEVEGYSGWVRQPGLWGLRKSEVIE